MTDPLGGERWRVIEGDCLDVLKTLEPGSVDAVVTDPPYGLGFMGKDWDHGVPGVHFWTAALRVAKPGAHLLAFGGTRTFHRLTCAIEDARWEIRDCLMWLYGSGFPKSHNLDGERKGWGTALKPAWEPIILARKPLEGTVAANVAANVAAHGTGALNINGCRIAGITPLRENTNGREGAFGLGSRLAVGDTARGRWPANVVLDEAAAAALDAATGELTGATGGTRRLDRSPFATGIGEREVIPTIYGDSGGASRFFYTAKASRAEREAGLDALEIVLVNYTAWDGEDRQARLRVDTAQSPPRVIGVSGTPDNDAIAWSMFLFGSGTMAPSLMDTKSITATATSSTTASRTLSYLARSLTSACTVGVSGAAPSGGSPAGSAARGGPCLTITSERAESRRGAEPAVSATPFTIRGNAASPADHPTVKPVDLMRWLARLVTPPGGLILDPFAGSGSTGVACMAEGFRFLGIELNADYCAIARHRIAEAAAQGNLFTEAKP